VFVFAVFLTLKRDANAFRLIPGLLQFGRSLWKQTRTAAVNLIHPDIDFFPFSEFHKNCSGCLSDIRSG